MLPISIKIIEVFLAGRRELVLLCAVDKSTVPGFE